MDFVDICITILLKKKIWIPKNIWSQEFQIRNCILVFNDYFKKWWIIENSIQSECGGIFVHVSNRSQAVSPFFL